MTFMAQHARKLAKQPSAVTSRVCAQRWALVAVLSLLLAAPVMPIAGGVWRTTSPVAPTEEESPSSESPAEEQIQSLTCPVNREDWIEGHKPRAVSRLQLHLSGARAGSAGHQPRGGEQFGRNGCGGPLRC
jgi:hypothetical protein